MIKYGVEDTHEPEYKTAYIFPEEEPDKLFVSFDIHGVGTEEPSARVTINVDEEFIKDISQKTGFKINDLVATGRAKEFKKYLVLRLDSNITLLHVDSK